jgi:glucose/arabinose dehydrogenase
MRRHRLATLVAAALIGCVPHPDAGAADEIRLTPVFTGLDDPVFLTHAGDERLFILEQAGRIRVARDGRLAERPFLEIRTLVRSGGERGLLGLAFHPAYARNGRFFVNYTRRPDGATVVAEYRVSADPNVAATEARILLVIPQPYSNHNGGMVAFGRDGFLYIGMGDGGSAGDPQNRAQNLQDLLGKMLRIDVDRGRPYGIPADNPFAAGGGRPEIFAWGLRNPWRFSFDRQGDDLWAGDVGQNAWEEVDVVRRGGNYGWPIMEGAHCYRPAASCERQGLEPPVAEYRNGGGRCSITGGYVYRGRQAPALAGTYLYGDYCSGEIFGYAGGASRRLAATRLAIASFGEDRDGEVYVVDLGGSVHRIDSGP